MNVFAVNNFGTYNRPNLKNQRTNSVSFQSGFEKRITPEMEQAINTAKKYWLGDGPGNAYQIARFEEKVEDITNGIRTMSEHSKKVLKEI